MSFAYHGNWCGPGWTAGQYKPSAALTDSDRDVPAIDQLDQACKNHDIGLHDATTDDDVKRVNRKFYREAASAGVKGIVAAALVGVLGPSHPGQSIICHERKSQQGFNTGT